jgi:hypothetical protein
LFFFCFSELFATNVKVRGRATSVVIDENSGVVTVNCDGFYQDDICYEMTTSANEVEIKNSMGEEIYSGILIEETVTEQDGIIVYQFQFE